MTATLPVYLQTNQNANTILARMLATLPTALDTSEGSFLWDSLSPASIELALAAMWAQQTQKLSFASTTNGNYLDLRVQEHGLTRLAATSATGTVTFTGTNGTVIPSGTQVSTGSSDTVPAVVFTTNANATIPAGGTINVAITAVNAGASGNVGSSTITFLPVTIPGVTGVNNATATTGGTDTESDAALLNRYLLKVQNPSAGGNKADYVNWALAASASVGGVSVIPVAGGAGTVSVVLIDTNKLPAAQSLVDTVQNYIAPGYSHTVEAETMTQGGNGVSTDATQTDASGSAVKMVYDATLAGILTESTMQTVLDKAGIWQLRLKVKVDSTAGATNLLDFGVYNVSGSAWAKDAASGGNDAHQTLKASSLTTSFATVNQDFYWNGSDVLELRITREQTDTTTTLWIDLAQYLSTFSTVDGGAKAPIGASVTVKAATAVPITVSATLTITSGYDVPTVQANVTAAVQAYITSLAFATDNDVRYSRLANAILDTAGVTDYSSLLVNGGTSNIVIDDQSVATSGTMTWS